MIIYLRCKRGGYLDNVNGGTKSGNNVRTYTFNGSNAQKSAGTTVISATTRDGSKKTAKCTLKVNPRKAVKVTGVKLSAGSLNLTPGSTAKLTETISPANASNKNVTWKSSNTKVAKANNTICITEGNTGKDVVLKRTYKIVNTSNGKFLGNGWSGEYFCGYISVN